MKIQIMTRHILDPTKSDLFEEATNTYKIGLYNLLVCLFHLISKGKKINKQRHSNEREGGTSKINARGATKDDLATKGEKIP